MSNYVIYYNTSKSMYRTLAVNWINFVSDKELTEEQRQGMKLFFRHIGKRFGLINEFKDIGVI